MTNYAVLDIETTNNNLYDRVCDPFNNRIVAWSLKTNKESITWYMREEEEIEILLDQIKESDVLVAHNAKFECMFLWKYPEFQEWLQRDGKIFCTQLAEYNLTNYQNQWAKLRDIAVNKYSCQDRNKWIDDLLFKNKQSLYKCVSELPEDKVLEDVESDTLDAESIYLQQLKLISERGLEITINNQMDTLLATIEMEYNGFSVDKNTLQTNQKELQLELAECQKEIQVIVDKYWRIA